MELTELEKEINEIAFYIEDYKTGNYKIERISANILPCNIEDLFKDLAADDAMSLGLNINEFIVIKYLSKIPNTKLYRLPIDIKSNFWKYQDFILEKEYNIDPNILSMKGVPDILSTNYNTKQYTFYEIKFGVDWLNKNQIDWLNKTGADLKIIMLAPIKDNDHFLSDKEIRQEIIKLTAARRRSNK